MDELAFQAHADPMEYRLRHLLNDRVRGVLQAVARAADWKAQTPGTQTAGKVQTSEQTQIAEQNRKVRGRGLACVAYEGDNGYAALVADVSVDLDSGIVQPLRFTIAIDCGPVSNPDGLRNQAEGGLLQGMSRALVEEVTWDERRVTSVDWIGYTSLRLDYETPEIETVIVAPRNVPATGAGETAITVVPAALGNAIFDATGARLRRVPFTPHRVLAALAESNQTGARSA
jgi:nicotinate dehydrogenase subunit B